MGFNIPVTPQGAFYIYADCSAITDDSFKWVHDLLEAEGVAVTPGIDFGAAGEGWLRFCCAASEETLREALERLGSVLPELS